MSRVFQRNRRDDRDGDEQVKMTGGECILLLGVHVDAAEDRIEHAEWNAEQGSAVAVVADGGGEFAHRFHGDVRIHMGRGIAEGRTVQGFRLAAGKEDGSAFCRHESEDPFEQTLQEQVRIGRTFDGEPGLPQRIENGLIRQDLRQNVAIHSQLQHASTIYPKSGERSADWCGTRTADPAHLPTLCSTFPMIVFRNILAVHPQETQNRRLDASNTALQRCSPRAAGSAWPKSVVPEEMHHPIFLRRSSLEARGPFRVVIWKERAG